MGSKIRPPGTSMGPFFSKTWYFDGSIFQNFLKFAPKWRKFGTLIGQLFKIFRNLRQNGANFSEKFWFLVHGWVTFPSKWVHGWVAFQKSQRHTPTQTKVEYPPPGRQISLAPNKLWATYMSHLSCTFLNKRWRRSSAIGIEKKPNQILTITIVASQMAAKLIED